MLNDAVIMAASRALARLAIQESADEPSLIATEIFRRCVMRPPMPQELDAICQFQAQQRERFQHGEHDPTPIMLDGSVQNDIPKGVDGPCFAAWIVTARALLNLDETITRQ